MGGKRILKLMVCIVCVLLIAISGVAFATASKPYKRYGCHFHDDRADRGTAYIDKCDCNPVSNYLASRVKIQGVIDGEYVTEGYTDWVEKVDTTTAYARATLSFSGGRCTYIWGQHKAQCGNGDKKSYSSNAKR
ncbi:MAG: hypothetical protein Q4E13_05980 [Clostridia bacterium]|nr:hypothetical protein [Clostridia bacterium]